MRSQHLRSLIAAMALVGFAQSGAQAAELISNGGFETSGLANTVGANCFGPNTTLNSWRAVNGNSCYIGTNYSPSWPHAHSGLASMFVNNNVAFGITVSQSVNLVAGTSYTLSFFLAGLNGYGNATVRVGIAGFQQDFTNTQGSSWVQETLSFTAAQTGATDLTFTSRGNAVELDDVSLTDGVVQTTPSVPEPDSLALGVLALGAAAAARRRNGC